MTDRTCSVEGCPKKIHARGMCQAHWRRLRHLENPALAVTCGFQGCEKMATSRKSGVCEMHYRRIRVHGDGNMVLGKTGLPISRHAIRDGLGRKRCDNCQDWHPVDRFKKCRYRPDGLSHLCQRCTSDLRHHLVIEARRKLLAIQDGSCANRGCGRVLEPNGSQIRTYHIDHDHSCCAGKNSCGKCIRGLLCSKCNVTLGSNRKECLLGLVDYLTNYRNQAGNAA